MSSLDHYKAEKIGFQNSRDVISIPQTVNLVSPQVQPSTYLDYDSDYVSLWEAGIFTRRDTEQYSQFPEMSEQLKSIGIIEKDLEAWNELSTFLSLVSFFDVQFPNKHTSRTSTYRTEFSKRVKDSFNNLLHVIGPSIESVLEVGGQEAKTGRHLLEYKRRYGQHPILHYDIVDQLNLVRTLPKVRKDTTARALRYINADALNLDRIDNTLRQSGTDGLRPQYDLSLAYHVMEHCQDPIGIFNEMWNRTKIGGYIVIDARKYMGISHEYEIPTEELSLYAQLTDQLRSVQSVMEFTGNQWHEVTDILLDIRLNVEQTRTPISEYFSLSGTQFETIQGRINDPSSSLFNCLLLIEKNRKESPFFGRKISGISAWTDHDYYSDEYIGTKKGKGSLLFQLYSVL